MARNVNNIQYFLLCSAVLVTCTCVAGANYDNQHLSAGISGYVMRMKRQTPNNGVCEHRIFERVMDCCDSPMLLSLAGFQNCSAGHIKNDLNIVRMMGYGFSQHTNTAKSEAVKTKVNTFHATTGGRQCIYECIFKNQELMSPSGNINIEVMTTKVLAVASAEWKPIVQAAITECNKLITEHNLLGPTSPHPGGKACSQAPLYLMACIYRYNILNCPTTVAFTGANCKDDVQKMKSCDIFAGQKKGGSA